MKLRLRNKARLAERARLTKALATPPKPPPGREVAQEIFTEKPQGGAKKRGAKAGRGNKASA